MLFPVPEDKLPAEGVGARVLCGEHDVALFRVGGELRALEDVCPHAGMPLHDGYLEDGVVECSFHGWGFDTRSGECTTAPGYDVATYAVKIEDGQVSIEIP